MIDITAKLVRGPAYFSGELIECCITFGNPTNPNHQISQSHSDVFESLAWASAQVHCQCSTNGKAVLSERLNSIQSAAINADTTFAPWQQDNGHVVLNTKPKILFCDLRLSPGESETYVYRERIPSDAPPSYRGQAVKYSYKITIGTQRVNSAIKLLRVPFRVLSLSELPDIAPCNDSVDLSPNNPFMETRQRDTPLDVAMQTLQNITARRSPNFYNVTNSRGRVVRFCLFKNSYKLGEDIVGTFDFSRATVSCAQVSVALQSEEHVAEGYRRARTSPALVSYNKHHEVCLGLKYSQLVLPIPLHVTPDFTTDLVTLKWRLHFEFVTTAMPVDMPNEKANDWRGPSSLDIETMIWDLPLRLHPTTTPPNAAQQTKYHIVI
ncbi:RAB6A-GEF complex partner protein 2 [Neodiprion pinetum]|uniref:RAB6A-GEF complex partner protein 2 n=1 Tax=Neodiprion lecontei TaxID=441921 RepID=A0A6J0BV33_NEOLC|nr:RAB6A-GEF complex partner protein 2 [Neodiprion lecontei]XP_015518746.1 RAB6A-GEF complex partner protein 2 [Neodiprion lecontei]XP_046434969.1 RAB6A-GEF complex partner protein 2 [Neodiprion fabricii]XP_046434970.1 RAB6A-GEF complex partner protein 2 [Neodiprion fabricii]XP_046434971.1 RAB6A-GEF complex partner protein 2 [Neodiprion fabricii]XP_046492045.1 RAB6A-GEF complex partner protein 2 [Neodiprion pinetum]XP_046492046.1 RAB6A-GEF complex partner protein 2 [Neodiprion pinetum]XP_046